MKSENITLYFTQGSSDKIYTARLMEFVDTGWVVNFAYGRRGKPQTTGTKTTSPVSYEKAKKIYDSLVNGKMAKGYTPGEDGAAYSATPSGLQVTGLLPQLLNPIKEEDFPNLFKEWSFVAFQIKYDGENRMVMTDDTHNVIAANRRGLQVTLPQEIEIAVQKLSRAAGPLILCTEDMGTHLVIFDVLRVGEHDLKTNSFMARSQHIDNLRHLAVNLGNDVPKYLSFETVTSVLNLTDLESWVDAAERNNEEGVVFKDPDAPFSVGRPSSGGPALKYKFVESATVQVLNRNQARSVEMAVICDDPHEEPGCLMPIGNCAIPPNHEVPAVGAYIEVEYLYAYKEGSLYQPVYKGLRSDKTEPDVHSSLKFKRDYPGEQ